MWMRVVLALLILLFTAHGNAASMRCGNKVVKTNDSRKTVQDRCGTPDRQAKGYIMIRINGLVSKQRVEQWTYYQGHGKHTKVIVFHQDRLVDVILVKKR